MPSTPRKSAALFVEPLEARIAPTGLTAITNPVNNSGHGSSDYVNYTTKPTAAKLGFVPGSTYGVNESDIFAIKLTGNGTVGADGLNTGDKLIIFNLNDGFNFASPFIQATNGTVIAFFRDDLATDPHHTHIENSELVGIAVSKGSSVSVNGSVHGDIVANLPVDGSHLLTTVKTKAGISGITVVGDVTGNILAGGSIDSVNINGNVGGIFAGSAAAGHSFHFGDPNVTTGKLAVKPAKPNRPGPSISNVSVNSISNALQAGNGGVHGDGGSITNVTVLNDASGFSLLSGNGGGGTSSLVAGDGGAINNVRVSGTTDTSFGLISIVSGHGGTSSANQGGAGGTIGAIAIGYDSFDAADITGQLSIDLIRDNVIIHAGSGGAGARGGAGGDVGGLLIATDSKDDGNTGTFETQIIAGDGGGTTSSKGGVGGAGGTVQQVTSQNFLTAVNTGAQGSTLLQGGAGGAAADGGDIAAVTLLGTRLTLNAGNGGDGVERGGKGGAVDMLTITSAPGTFASAVAINAGAGGDTVLNSGGDGGDIQTVRMVNAQLTSLTIDSGTHGNGGNSTHGAGGFGGAVTDIIINDGGTFLSQGAPVVVRTGTGGSGALGGGSGGDFSSVQITGTDLAYTVNTGNGGTGGTGTAGDGGGIINVGISNQAVDAEAALTSAGSTLITQISSANTARVVSGNGGSSTTGLGGSGGDINGLSVTSFVNTTPQPNLNAKPAHFQADNYTIISGSGASGGAGAGKGGDISASAASSAFGAITVRTGSAGAAGGALADGGNIDGFVAAALGHITMLTGNGGAGGAGGDITNSGTNLAPITNPATGLITTTNNRGGLTVQAGHGSVANGSGGSGGSITNFSGFISRGGVTSLTGGKGGSGAVKRAGAGGSVEQIKLTGVNNAVVGTLGSTVTIDAGDAGVGTKLKRGRDGGDVADVTIFDVDPDTVIQHIAAGDASSGRLSSGDGGSVSEVHAGLATEIVDIGIRSGRARGYNINTGAGGIFAGLGGNGGLSGNVTDVTAAAIASIVAGKGTAFGLVNTVDDIFLDGLIAATANSNGSYKNFDSANLVGSVVDPTAAHATTYNSTTSGLIAAINLTANRNFVPEAVETFSPSGQLDIFDIRQPGKPVITQVG